jgi:hypothetical protein
LEFPVATILVNVDLLWSSNKPRGGHAMYVLQWLRGLRRLGHRAVLLDFFPWKPDKHGDAPRLAFEGIMNEWWRLEDAVLVDAASLRRVGGMDDAAFARVLDAADALVEAERREVLPQPLQSARDPLGRLLAGRDHLQPGDFVPQRLEAQRPIQEHP